MTSTTAPAFITCMYGMDKESGVVFLHGLVLLKLERGRLELERGRLVVTSRSLVLKSLMSGSVASGSVVSGSLVSGSTVSWCLMIGLLVPG